jgi:hypothetical protein
VQAPQPCATAINRRPLLGSAAVSYIRKCRGNLTRTEFIANEMTINRDVKPCRCAILCGLESLTEKILIFILLLMD